MEDLIKRIEYKWEADTKTPLLLASPGSGKTAFVNYLANTLDVDIRTVNLSTFEEIDMNGMPYIDPDTHKIKVTKPAFIEGLKDGDVLFFDEVNLASSGVRNALQTFILSKLLPDGTPAPRVRIIAAMNVGEDLESVADFSPAMKDRWAYIPFNFPIDEWHTLYKDNFGKPQTEREKKIREKLSKYLTINPHMVEKRKPISAKTYGITDPYESAAAEAGTPNRRNWDNLARELACTKDDSEMKHMQKNIFIENVGLECWRNYKEYILTENKPLSTYEWDGEPDEISQQINRLKGETNVDKQVAYFARAYKYCKSKEVIMSLIPEILKNAIDKYGIEYRNELPEFYEIYSKVGA